MGNDEFSKEGVTEVLICLALSTIIFRFFYIRRVQKGLMGNDQAR
jgi:hypothetical protein